MDGDSSFFDLSEQRSKLKHLGGMRSPTEGELGRMIGEGHKFLEGCYRQMAHARGDVRWLQMASIFNTLYKKQIELQQKKTGRRGTLILPEDVENWVTPNLRY